MLSSCFDNDIIEHYKVKPFLKWAGGKGQLLTEIEKFYPFKDKKINKYAEPFVGGGAVLFDILNKFNVDKIYISDINLELINTYSVIKSNINELIELLSNMQEHYARLPWNEKKIFYLDQREQFNKLKSLNNSELNIEKAALLIFLNKTCFNGLFRVNRKGIFNVPMGSYKNPLICDEINLRAVSNKLKDVTIVCGDYTKSESFIDCNTFVYFDPPYRPLTNTSSFTAYTDSVFNDNEQINLANFIDEMNQRGAKIVVSNSDPKNVDITDNFFDSIYSSYNIHRVEAARMISCNSESRKKIKELIISNYEVKDEA